MANFAQLDESGVVRKVVSVEDSYTATEDGLENENIGIIYCKQQYGEDTIWKQTSFNGNFRKNFAKPGYIYIEVLDAFIAPGLYRSWLLNEDTCTWYPPIPYPNDGLDYVWNEETLSWDLVV